MEAKYFRFLKMVGIGYRARTEAEGRVLFLNIGFNHEVELTVPPAVRVFCLQRKTSRLICIAGIDERRVYQFAGTVRTCKPPERYKGKGIHYCDNIVKMLAGPGNKTDFYKWGPRRWC